ncbi:anthrone oxygenase family protein [Micromonospora sp. WMMD1274]
MLTVVAVTGAGLTAGVLFCVAISLVPGFFALPASGYVEAHKLYGRYFDRIMPPIVVTTTVLTVMLAVRDQPGGSRPLFIVAALSLLGVSLVSQFGNVPINRAVKRLTADRVTYDWQDPRPVWRTWHLLRTALALLALVLLALAGAS